MSGADITINLGTILLVTEILKQERGVDFLPKNAAGDAIKDAVKALQERQG